MTEEKDIYEWDFPVPSSQVDLERIAYECEYISTIMALIYLKSLREKAPVVFKRLKAWALKEKRMRYYDWSRK